MKLLSEIGDFVKKEVSIVEGGFKKGEAALLGVAGHANTILNEAKAWAASPGGKTLLGIIEQLPVVGPFAEEIVNTILPEALTGLGVIQAIPNESIPDAETAIAAGVTAIAGKKDGDVVASTFTSVQAIITNKVAPMLNVASTIQSALSVAPAVYASNKEA